MFILLGWLVIRVGETGSSIVREDQKIKATLFFRERLVKLRRMIYILKMLMVMKQDEP
jgi:hypothetical protein